MDETKELLKAIMGRLEEMGAELKGLRLEVQGLGTQVEGLGTQVEGLSAGQKELRQDVQGLSAELKTFRNDANERLEKIEERLDHLGVKWLEHDAEILKIKRRQA
ncbi:MAG TPA: hypothetical protein VK464_28895 [Symbiobacteriaceae bacterium]|nr:hypothetical protein [Symbiobacteriaceae bacterium]